MGAHEAAGSASNGAATALPANATTPTSSNNKAGPKKLSLAERLWMPGASTPIPSHLGMAALRIALTAFVLGTLAGIALPRALPALYAVVTTAITGRRSSAANWIGDTMKNGIELSSPSVWLRPQLHIYLLAWATFHLLEFVITARYNATRLFADSFLISNGVSYHLAHIFGICEFLVEAKLAPQSKELAWWTALGLFLVVAGQFIRSLAMVHAAGNFSHEVATRKRDDHQLVTDGIYSYFRHPSYAGFFYWAIGTQIMLGNIVSTAVFSVVLWRFFSSRIRGEEVHLTYFFGQAYRDFKASTSTRIPFIP